ncbi:MAG: metallophosphoesterase [Clostridia bacterium]|nr:metallophosphoesterase [Clostridia bacterium]
MKILVMSDSHGFSGTVKSILKKERSCDAVIHLGDGGADMLEMNEYTAGKPVYQVKGNCDISAYNFPPKLISYIGDTKFLACHGHAYNVKNDLGALFYAAKENGCTLALFGHTHIPLKEQYEDVTLINPGSVMNRRYCIITKHYGGIEITHCQLNDED